MNQLYMFFLSNNHNTQYIAGGKGLSLISLMDVFISLQNFAA